MTDALIWFRRDLRLDDHRPLAEALASHRRVHACFVFDERLLDTVRSRGPGAARRMAFLLAALDALAAELAGQGGRLILRRGDPRAEIPALAQQLGVATVFAGRDYSPYGRHRDQAVGAALTEAGIAWREIKDQVIFDRNDVLTKTGQPFSVFTPYRRAWMARLQPGDWASVTADATGRWGEGDPSRDPLPVPTLAALGWPGAAIDLRLPVGASGAMALLEDFATRLDRYRESRDFPALKGPSYLSAHLRFGTVSPRRLVALAHSRLGADPGLGAETWLSELIWREFYQMILWHHPTVLSRCFRPVFDALAWETSTADFEAWRLGQTGYPLVDAGMRQLLASGYMHNRLRMVTASFLCKDLGLDWRLGERHFADQLIDFDPAANNGGWQWAASTGCDAQPWFRIFNPVTQSEKFDPDGRFIRRYVPELSDVPDRYIHAPWRMPEAIQQACGVRIGIDYPAPRVDHDTARQQTLARYRRVSANPGTVAISDS